MRECKHLYYTSFGSRVCGVNGKFFKLRKDPQRCVNCSYFEIGEKDQNESAAFRIADFLDALKINLMDCYFMNEMYGGSECYMCAYNELCYNINNAHRNDTEN